MSSFTIGAADAMISVPTKMIGVSSSIAVRMPQASAAVPMTGRITRPGSTHNAETE